MRHTVQIRFRPRLRVAGVRVTLRSLDNGANLVPATAVPHVHLNRAALRACEQPLPLRRALAEVQLVHTRHRRGVEASSGGHLHINCLRGDGSLECLQLLHRRHFIVVRGPDTQHAVRATCRNVTRTRHTHRPHNARVVNALHDHSFTPSNSWHGDIHHAAAPHLHGAVLRRGEKKVP
ncbi:hypothetical protein DQ04_09901000 [Trypanosoma grayi]|uniref:hypothetical protein n=1 Tax=Trypanosoma grayi TaxID=71804 RepID=UPI0004F40822|nr:hypothetical protein DQ04_09901000 [Trypanosoma grayi]KEG07402.1 hypothetical protein DQ04_09901000 [Trypanosoma grayi]